MGTGRADSRRGHRGDDVSGVPGHDNLAGGDSAAVHREDGEEHPPESRDGAGVFGDVRYRAVLTGFGRVSVPDIHAHL